MQGWLPDTNIGSTRAGAEVTTEPRLVWETEAELGEGPVWVERDSALWFTDIKQQRIYRYDPANGGQQSWHSPEQVGFIVSIPGTARSTS
jgi:sugar lactone lactonase YvrE